MIAGFLCALMFLPVAFSAMMVASGGTPPTTVSFSDWSSVLSAITSQISVSTVVGVLAGTIGAGIGLVFMWWGVRKLVRFLMGAFRRGRMSV